MVGRCACPYPLGGGLHPCLIPWSRLSRRVSQTAPPAEAGRAVGLRYSHQRTGSAFAFACGCCARTGWARSYRPLATDAARPGVVRPGHATASGLGSVVYTHTRTAGSQGRRTDARGRSTNGRPGDRSGHGLHVQSSPSTPTLHAHNGPRNWPAPGATATRIRRGLRRRYAGFRLRSARQ